MRLVAVFSVFGVPYLVLMPVLARDVLHTDASGYGLLLTCVGIGAIAAALTLAALGRRARQGWLLERAAYAFSALLIALALSRSVWLSAALMVTVGFTMILNNALANTLLQSIVPDALRGRVMAAYALVFIGFSPIGHLLGGDGGEWVWRAVGDRERRGGDARVLGVGVLAVSGDSGAVSSTRKGRVLRELPNHANNTRITRIRFGAVISRAGQTPVVSLRRAIPHGADSCDSSRYARDAAVRSSALAHRSPSCPRVNRTKPVPSTFTTYTSATPFGAAEKRIRRPSGDQLGCACA